MTGKDILMEMISIPVEEYKKLLLAQVELSIIYHRSIESSSSRFDIGSLVDDMRESLHPPIKHNRQEALDAE